jgi:hypothetical protein
MIIFVGLAVERVGEKAYLQYKSNARQNDEEATNCLGLTYLSFI